MSELDDAHDLTRRMLDETREEITRADGKANILLAAVGVGIGAVLAAAFTGDVSPSQLSHDLEWLCWVGLTLIGIGVLKLGVAVRPVLKTHRKDHHVYYFADVAAFGKDREGLKGALKTEAGSRFDRDVEQLSAVSNLVTRKYKHTRSAMHLLAIGVALCVVSVVVDVLV